MPIPSPKSPKASLSRICTLTPFFPFFPVFPLPSTTATFTASAVSRQPQRGGTTQPRASSAGAPPWEPGAVPPVSNPSPEWAGQPRPRTPAWVRIRLPIESTGRDNLAATEEGVGRFRWNLLERKCFYPQSSYQPAACTTLSRPFRAGPGAGVRGDVAQGGARRGLTCPGLRCAAPLGLKGLDRVSPKLAAKNRFRRSMPSSFGTLISHF